MVFVSPQVDRAGKHRYIVCFKDITPLRAAQTELSDTTEILDGLFSVSLDMLCVFSEEGKILIVNNACEDMLGYKVDIYENINQFDLIHPEDLAVMSKSLHAIINSNQTIVLKNRCLHNDGTYRDIEWKVTHHGIYFFASGRDITDKLYRENEIKRNTDRLETIASIMLTRFVSLPALLDYALEQAIRLTNSKLGYIFFYDEMTEMFTLSALSKELKSDNPAHANINEYKLNETGLWGEVVRKRKPVMINEYPSGSLRRMASLWVRFTLNASYLCHY